MNCKCSSHPPVAFDRTSINKRIRETKKILPTLTVVAENKELCLTLLMCPRCGQFWQTGHEWHFKNSEYVFQVPEIAINDWLSEPYAQPAAMMLFTALMQDFCEKNSLEDGEKGCRVEGCDNRAIMSGVFCQAHHMEQLRKVGLLPKQPSGRLFPPYE